MAMLSQEISVPVYFSKYNTELESVIEDLSKIKLDDNLDEINQAGKRDSALGEIMNSISANGYQVCLPISSLKTVARSSIDL